VHQKCAVIFGIELTWQDTDKIEASIHCNPTVGFLARLVEVNCVKKAYGPQLMQAAVALGTLGEVRNARWGAKWMGSEPDPNKQAKGSLSDTRFDDDDVAYTSQ
jgi:hypothetical protein